MSRVRCSLLLSVLVLVASACQSVSSAKVPDLDVRRYAAVVAYYEDGPRGKRAPGGLADKLIERFRMELLARDVRVVARDQLDALLDEHRLNLSDMSAESRNAIGNITATDGIFKVSVVDYKETRGKKGSVSIRGTVVATLIDLETGEEVWKAEGSPRFFRQIDDLPEYVMAEWPTGL